MENEFGLGNNVHECQSLFMSFGRIFGVKDGLVKMASRLDESFFTTQVPISPCKVGNQI